VVSEVSLKEEIMTGIPTKELVQEAGVQIGKELSKNDRLA